MLDAKNKAAWPQIYQASLGGAAATPRTVERAN
jgi:hypothetical protein